MFTIQFILSGLVLFYMYKDSSIQEEIKCSLKSGNACYHSVQNLSSSSVCPKI